MKWIKTEFKKRKYLKLLETDMWANSMPVAIPMLVFQIAPLFPQTLRATWWGGIVRVQASSNSAYGSLRNGWLDLPYWLGCGFDDFVGVHIPWFRYHPMKCNFAVWIEMDVFLFTRKISLFTNYQHWETNGSKMGSNQTQLQVGALTTPLTSRWKRRIVDTFKAIYRGPIAPILGGSSPFGSHKFRPFGRGITRSSWWFWTTY